MQSQSKRWNWKGKLGVAGVSPYETPIAKKLGNWFEIPMLSLAILIPFRWYFEFEGRLATKTLHALDWLIWGLFVAETLLLLASVRWKLQYLKQNWLNLLIILVIFPPIWHSAPLPAALRLIRLIALIDVYIRMVHVIHHFLRQNNLGTTLLASAVIIVISGILISVIDPGIDTPFDGVWWAWVTVSTVGYGDYVPVSITGRLFAIFLILLGIGLFALLTAQVSAVLIGQVGKDMDKMSQEMQQIENVEATIHLKLEQLERRLDRIEQLLSTGVERSK